jgi:hypothetical protein
MAAAEFPLPSVTGSNPAPLFYEALPEEFVVGKTIYDDGGADFRLQAGGAGVRRWILEYDGLTDAQAAILDAHLATTFFSPDEGSAVGFNFRAHVPGTVWTDTSGTLYANVHYEKYEKGHKKTWANKRTITLVKRP